MVYAIYEEFFYDIEKKLTRITKKCQKYGNPFSYKVVGEEIRENKEEHEFFKFILIDVEGTAKIDDWECVAVLNIHESGNVVRRINTEIDVPERFQTSENVCEHCGVRRQRTNLYVIHNTITNEWKQVGGSCLKLYTGGLSLEYVAAFMDGITALEENDGVFGSNGKSYYTVKEVLGYAVEFIDKIGYYNSNSNIPTKSLVSVMMWHQSFSERLSEINKRFADAGMYNVDFSKSDFDKENTKEKVEAIINYYKNLNPDTEFIHNIQIMLKEEYIEFKNFGFICYLPEGYNKYLQIESKKAAVAAERAKEKSEYYGEVGKRYKNIKVRAINQIACWENVYGTTHVYKIVLDDFSVLTWKASVCVYTQDDEVFDTISFTVKAHTEYKGQKQTEVTRCKVSVKEAA